MNDNPNGNNWGYSANTANNWGPPSNHNSNSNSTSAPWSNSSNNNNNNNNNSKKGNNEEDSDNDDDNSLDSEDGNIELQEALQILNPKAGEVWRKLPERYMGATMHTIVPPTKLTEADAVHFQVGTEPYRTWFHVKTNTERGEEIAESYFLPHYLPNIQKWIAKQNAFVESLNAREKFTLQAYSLYGDRLVNRYLRDQRSDVDDLFEAMEENFVMPFMYQIYDNYDKLIKRGIYLPPRKTIQTMNESMYVEIVKGSHDLFVDLDVVLLLSKGFFQDLMRIFLKAPRLSSPIVTYRGILSEAHVKSLDFRSIDFQSTSLNPYRALNFASTVGRPLTQEEQHVVYNINTGEIKPPKIDVRRKKFGYIFCCIYEIKVDPSVPCIYLEGLTKIKKEFEVLLPPGIDMKLSDTIDIRTFVMPPGARIIVDKPPIKLGVKVSEEMKDKMIKKYLKRAAKFAGLNRISVVQAEATSVYFKKANRRPALVLNTSLRYGRNHKTKKAHRTPTVTKKNRAFAKRALLRRKTLKKKGRRMSVRNNNSNKSNNRNNRNNRNNNSKYTSNNNEKVPSNNYSFDSNA